MSDEHVAQVFRIPPQMLGLTTAPFSLTESLLRFWLASGLGFAINPIEETFGLLFDLAGQPDEYVEFDTGALLRTDQKDRIEGLVRAVQGGVYSVNEARNMEDLPSVEYGDEPRVQAQVVPLSAAAAIPSAPAAAVPPSAPATKNYQKAVRRDVKALTERANGKVARDGAEKAVIRKTRTIFSCR